jgi:hypothetical protein
MAKCMGKKYPHSMKKLPKTIKEMRQKAHKEQLTGEAKPTFLDATNDVAFV